MFRALRPRSRSRTRRFAETPGRAAPARLVESPPPQEAAPRAWCATACTTNENGCQLVNNLNFRRKKAVRRAASGQHDANALMEDTGMFC